MRSRLELGLLLALTAACAGAQAPVSPPAAASAPTLTASAVKAAVEQVRKDPAMPGVGKERTLRFKVEDKNAKKPPKPDASERWWLDAFESMSAGLRILVWIVAAGLFVFVLLRLREWLLGRQGDVAPAALTPTHVGSLDIRPESLPADVGTTARELWARAEARAAMSLLYRAALSRLVHQHRVPIRSATTEAECLRLAAPRVSAEAQAFLAVLVGGWQSVAYAKRLPQADVIEQLCAEFDRQLPAAGAGA